MPGAPWANWGAYIRIPKESLAAHPGGAEESLLGVLGGLRAGWGPQGLGGAAGQWEWTGLWVSALG